ncbi:MAG: enoyl-CoA hydratase/isomerase family protein [Chloroflexi bacterium]|nr:enoyl-CoA hydratase/isomerase family protein [Chloroflexota bacterium]
MELETMGWERRGRVAYVTLRRPHVLNAMNTHATLDLSAVADAIGDDSELRVVVISGAGRAFCTGIDLKELSRGESPLSYHHHFERALRRFETMDKLVLAAIHGWCLGGGLQLALACDLRVASAEAQFGLPAVVESLIPGLATYRLWRYVGMGWAKRLILGGENLSAEQAQRIGLVDYVVEAAAFEAEVGRIVERFLETASVGCRLSKGLINQAPDLPYELFLQRYLELQAVAQTSDDHAEAMAAYRERREPRWK